MTCLRVTRRVLKSLLILLVLLVPPIFAGTSKGTHGAVASRSQLASDVGIDMLKAGGNGVDAAVATAFVLAVVYPAAGNIGGGGFMVIRQPDGTVVTNDHREKAPLLAKEDMLLTDGIYDRQKALKSYLSSGVPGSVAGLLAVHERFGELEREVVMAPAIQIAAEGFELPPDIARSIGAFEDSWQKHPASKKVFLKSDGSTYEAGEIFKQPMLAAALNRISENGKAGFYEGKTAEMIATAMKQNGGLVTLADLRAYESAWRDPIVGSYRNVDIYSMPPPSSGGVLVVQMLNAIEPFDVGGLGFGSSSLMHLMIEAERRAYADRSEHLGDTDFYDVPLTTLTDKAYASKRMADFDADHASVSDNITYGAFEESPETTHLSVHEKDGYSVAYTTTINHAYGSKIVVDGAGFLLNNEMDDFSATPGQPNSFGLLGAEANKIEPGKRMLSSMTPTIVTVDDQVKLITGSPGGSTIITTVLQMVVNVVDHGQSVLEAASSPRFHFQWFPTNVRVEPGFDESVIRELEAKGHEFTNVPAIGDVNQIGVSGDEITAVSDPRHAGGAAAY